MYSNCDDGLVDFLYFKPNEYEELGELKLFQALARESSCILDIGANTGLYSLVSKKVNPNVRLYSFEPYHINRNRLEKNLKINDISDVQVIPKALGEENKMIPFAVPENEQICTVLSADTAFTRKFFRKWVNYKDIELEQVRLDDLIKNEELEKIDLIKIDVENYELTVLRGAFDTLDCFEPIIFIESFVDEERQAFFQNELATRGYYCYAVLKQGLLRLDQMSANPDSKDFILSKSKSVKRYISFSDPDILLELRQRTTAPSA